MKKSSRNVVKSICLNATFAALYFVLVIAFGDISFGFANGLISLRIAEILIALCIFDKRFIPGAIIGCFCANLLSGQVVDLIVGTIQSTITVYLLYYIKNKQLALVLGSFMCGLMIGLEIYFLGFSAIGLWVIVTTFIGELLILEIGYFLFKRYYNLIIKK